MLVGLTLFVQLAAAAIAAALTAGPSTPVPTPEQSTDASTGGFMVGAIIAETIGIVVLWKLASLLPAWARKVLKYSIGVSLLAIAGWVSFQFLGGGAVAAAELLTAFAIGIALVHFDLYWIQHNVLAVMLGIGAAVSIGFNFSPPVVLVLLALITVWDMVAVWGTDWMDNLMGATARTFLPVFVVLPNRLRFEMEPLREWLDDRDGPKPDGVAGILGVGDLGLPAALTASAVVAFPGGVDHPAVLGCILGVTLAMIVLRGSLDGSDGLPALPWLTTGAIGGFAIGIGVSGVPLLAVLGGGV